MLDKFIRLMTNDDEICSRGDFISFILLEIVFAVMTVLVFIILGNFIPNISTFFIFIFFLIEYIIFIILCTKRMNDLNINKYFIIAIIFIPFLAFTLLDQTNEYKDSKNKLKEQELKPDDENLIHLIEILEKEKNEGEKHE